MGISWDEFYKEEAPVKKEEKVTEPRVVEVSEETKQAVGAPVQTEGAQNVPTEDVTSEVMQNIENYTTKKDPSEDDLQKVREKMDEVLQGRVQVGQKAMINSKADLNQLVPFKYKWA